MKKINLIFIILLMMAIVFALKLPKKEKKYPFLEREIPPPQKEENIITSPTPLISPEVLKKEEKVEIEESLSNQEEFRQDW